MIEAKQTANSSLYPLYNRCFKHEMTCSAFWVSFLTAMIMLKTSLEVKPIYKPYHS